MTEPLEAASAALVEALRYQIPRSRARALALAAVVGGVSFALGAPLWAFWAVTAITFLGESRR